jgi:hypothetical protein
MAELTETTKDRCQNEPKFEPGLSEVLSEGLCRYRVDLNYCHKVQLTNPTTVLVRECAVFLVTCSISKLSLQTWRNSQSHFKMSHIFPEYTTA